MEWTTQEARTCMEAARQFADEAFDGLRTVLATGLRGQWTGRTWSGQFRLCGGVKLYRLTFDGTRWVVRD